MAQAARDQNRVTTLLGISSSDGVTPINVKVNPSTGAMLVQGSGGSGTVTSVSVVSANGFAGSVANATTTPAITLSTTITGILSGNGTAISAASTTGSGAVVLATSPTLVTPVLGAATATTINGLTISTSTGTLTVANGSSLITSGANSITLTSTGATNVTLPTTGTLATLAGSEALTNKSINGLTITSSTGTLTITNGKTLSISNTLTLAGTDGTTMTFPSGSGTVLTADSTATLTNKTIGVSQLSGQVALTNGGTAANLSDPNADRIMFWDDSAGGVTWLTAGTGLTITDTTITASGSGAANQITISSVYEASAGFYLQTDGTGTHTFSNNGVGVVTGNGSASYARLRKMVPRGVSTSLTYAKIFEGTVVFGTDFCWLTAPATLSGFWGVGDVTVTGAGGHTYTVDQMGFKQVWTAGDQVLSCTNADGTTETATAATDVASGTVSRFSLIKTSTTNIKFYQDRTLKATHTTNLPSEDAAVGSYWQLSNSNINTSEETNYFFSYSCYQQDLV